MKFLNKVRFGFYCVVPAYDTLLLDADIAYTILLIGGLGPLDVLWLVISLPNSL